MEVGSIEELEAMCHFIDCCYYFIKQVKLYIDSTFFTTEDSRELIISINLLKNLIFKCANKIILGISYD
ncbi:hypothetical protein [Vallitalea maricola]|uniref:Uncharacterized protein n=1 Tax=Vallitalea maricola TaxID=3074433 RepID=A0ACB5UJ92_9FIRM|nr:hypothetical protein AN2V17_18970 [Vallitalea sp. AN17-2]